MSNTALLFLTQSLILAVKGQEDPEAMNTESAIDVGSGQAEPETPYPSTYFTLQDHKALIYGHISLMVIAWMIILPVGKYQCSHDISTVSIYLVNYNAATMLSLAQYRHKSLAQLSFLVSNAFGLLLGIIYNSNTPDLYPNNAHHKLGWMLTWLAAAHFIICQIDKVSRIMRRFVTPQDHSTQHQEFLPLTPEPIEEQSCEAGLLRDMLSLSSDSGLGTALHTESSPSPSKASDVLSSTEAGSTYHLAEDHEPPDARLDNFPSASACDETWNAKTRRASKNLLTLLWKVRFFVPSLVNRILLILGFASVCTGIVTFGRIFVSRSSSYKHAALS